MSRRSNINSRRIHRFALLQATIASAGLFALGACVAPAPQPTPAPSSTPQPAPLLPTPSPAPVLQAANADWTTAPLTPGDWHYRAAAGQHMAEFRSPAGGAIAQISCAGSQVLITLLANAPRANAITIRTETLDRALPASGSNSAVVSAVMPGDALLDAMAFSKGRFSLEVLGGPHLVLPPYPEVTRAIEECRR